MNFREMHFTTSAPKLSGCPADSLAEVAFAGRSNAGKSSAINSLAEQPGLARISKTPGRTQLINFFSLAPGRYLVDLPGYGFAKVPLAVKEKWQRELEQYLRRRQQLAGLVLLMDIRHPLKDFDRMMIDWAGQAGLPLLVLLTKADKLKRGAAQNALLAVRRELADGAETRVELFSALKQTGIKAVRAQLTQWLEASDGEDEPAVESDPGATAGSESDQEQSPS